MRSIAGKSLILTLVLLAWLAVMVAGCILPASPPADGAQPTARVTPVERSNATAQGGATATATPARPRSGLPTIRYQDLPRQAQDTIALIEQGGPFPFRRDGVTFQNRERILPSKPSGYYREYTVVTPGSSDRGARRIVAGSAGELYYTNDHYESFREVVR